MTIPSRQRLSRVFFFTFKFLSRDRLHSRNAADAPRKLFAASRLYYYYYILYDMAAAGWYVRATLYLVYPVCQALNKYTVTAVERPLVTYSKGDFLNPTYSSHFKSSCCKSHKERRRRNFPLPSHTSTTRPLLLLLLEYRKERFIHYIIYSHIDTRVRTRHGGTAVTIITILYCYILHTTI